MEKSTRAMRNALLGDYIRMREEWRDKRDAIAKELVANDSSLCWQSAIKQADHTLKARGIHPPPHNSTKRLTVKT